MNACPENTVEKAWQCFQAIGVQTAKVVSRKVNNISFDYFFLYHYDPILRFIGHWFKQ
jgi:hypothetical protein